MENYPFALPHELTSRLPHAARDGNYYVDVLVHHTWDGVLVVNSAGECIGAYFGRRLQDFPLPFAPADIRDIRRACRWHRFLAALPVEPAWSAGASLFLLAPVCLLLGWLVWLPFTLGTLAVCTLSLIVLVPDRRFGAFPLVLLAVSELLGCGFLYMRTLRHWAEALAVQ
jgi:hypothetical protein